MTVQTKIHGIQNVQGVFETEAIIPIRTEIKGEMTHQQYAKKIS